MCSMIDHQRNANPNHNESQAHSSQNSAYRKQSTQKVGRANWRNGETGPPSKRMHISSAIVEKRVAILKNKNITDDSVLQQAHK